MRTRVLANEPRIPTTDLFGDRELYAAEGVSGDSESTLEYRSSGPLPQKKNVTQSEEV